MVIDLKNWKVVWMSNGIKVGEASINASMRSKKLYMIVIMCSFFDQVEILRIE